MIKDCGQFHKNGCPHHAKLQVIFGDNTTISHNVHPLIKMPSDSEYDDDDSDGVEEVGQEEDDDLLKSKLKNVLKRR